MPRGKRAATKRKAEREAAVSDDDSDSDFRAGGAEGGESNELEGLAEEVASGASWLKKTSLDLIAANASTEEMHTMKVAYTTLLRKVEGCVNAINAEELTSKFTEDTGELEWAGPSTGDLSVLPASAIVNIMQHLDAWDIYNCAQLGTAWHGLSKRPEPYRKFNTTSKFDGNVKKTRINRTTVLLPLLNKPKHRLLTSLKVPYNTPIGPSFFNQLRKALPFLSDLNLSSAKSLKPDTLKNLAESFNTLKRLVVGTLSCYGQEESRFESLVATVCERNQGLEEFQYRPGHAPSDLVVRTLADHCPRLRHVKLTGSDWRYSNNPERANAAEKLHVKEESLLRLVKECPDLQVLDLYGIDVAHSNKLGNNGEAFTAKVRAINPTCKVFVSSPEKRLGT